MAFIKPISTAGGLTWIHAVEEVIWNSPGIQLNINNRKTVAFMDVW